MSLEEMRARVIFHNSLDVWVSLCVERGVRWEDPPAYRKFVAYLRDKGLNMRAFNLCAHEAGSDDGARTRMAEALAQDSGNPDSRVYTVRLSDSALGLIRKYVTS